MSDLEKAILFLANQKSDNENFLIGIYESDLSANRKIWLSLRKILARNPTAPLQLRESLLALGSSEINYALGRGSRSRDSVYMALWNTGNTREKRVLLEQGLATWEEFSEVVSETIAAGIKGGGRSFLHKIMPRYPKYLKRLVEQGHTWLMVESWHNGRTEKLTIKELHRELNPETHFIKWSYLYKAHPLKNYIVELAKQAKSQQALRFLAEIGGDATYIKERLRLYNEKGELRPEVVDWGWDDGEELIFFAKNPYCPEEVLRWLASKELLGGKIRSEVIWNILRNPMCPRDLFLENFTKSSFPSILSGLSLQRYRWEEGSRVVSDQELNLLLESIAIVDWEQLPLHFAFSFQQVQFLKNFNADRKFWKNICMSIWTPGEALELFKDEEEEIRLVLAQNPHTPPSTLTYLLENSSEGALAALRNPSLPKWSRQGIFKNKNFSKFYFNRKDIKKLLEVTTMEELLKLPFSILTISNTPQFVQSIQKHFVTQEQLVFFFSLLEGWNEPLYTTILLGALLDSKNNSEMAVRRVLSEEES